MITRGVINMQKKIPVLILGLIVLHFLIHFAPYLPDFVHGHINFTAIVTREAGWIRGMGGWFGSTMALLFSFLFALFPYLALSRFYPEKKFLKIIIFLNLSLGGSFLLGWYWTKLQQPEIISIYDQFKATGFLYSIDFLYGTLFYLVRYIRFKEWQQKELLLLNRQSEISFLRSQINPHFLFNNLNNIYSLVYYKSDLALEAIFGLSDLLRYMVYDMNEKVTLSREVTYIQKYIALQNLRFEHCPVVNLRVNGSTEETLVPPLLFIPFIENAFKHGDLGVAEDCLHISLKSDETAIHFHCYNRKIKKNEFGTTGIGIDNVKKRLSLLYPDRHSLEIIDRPDHFIINLQLIQSQ